MELRELKTKIENQSLDITLLVFLCEKEDFTANQYVEAICKFKKLHKIYIDTVDDMTNAEVFDISKNDTSLYIWHTDELKVKGAENLDLTKFHNTIILCKKIPDSLLALLGSYIVIFPTLVHWQILDYTKSKLPGLDNNEVEWLVDICKDDINRLSNEIDKISIFSKGAQKLMLKEMQENNNYKDLNPLTIFNFSNAILKNDIEGMKDVLKSINDIDVEPTGLVTILLRNYKNFIDVKLTPGITAEDLGMNYKQFNAIKWGSSSYNKMQLVSIYEMLTSIDFKLKSGNLDNNLIVDYVITHIASVR